MIWLVATHYANAQVRWIVVDECSTEAAAKGMAERRAVEVDSHYAAVFRQVGEARARAVTDWSDVEWTDGPAPVSDDTGPR